MPDARAAKISILILEGGPLLRQLLERMLALHDDFSFSSSVGDGRLVLHVIRATTPSRLLLDLTLPGMHGLVVLDRLIDFPDAPYVLVLRGHESDEIQMQSARHGAHGFLGKSQGVEALPEAIRAISRRPGLVQTLSDGPHLHGVCASGPPG